jgi:RimJ/RimL family protein N-acetyltransferase
MRAIRSKFLMPRAATLGGDHVVLTPLSRRDAADLAQVPDDPAWELLLRKPAGPSTSSGAWLREALRAARRGSERSWTIRDRATGQLLGSTRYLNIDVVNRRLEIGATWLLTEARGTAANAESKLLLLDHAFDDLGMQRVHIQADVRNTVSRRAIEALGASFEGVMRQHIVLADGSSRDTAVYSMIAPDWSELRPALAARVEARAAGWRARVSSLDAARDAQSAEPLTAAMSSGVTYSSTSDAMISSGTASAVA